MHITKSFFGSGHGLYFSALKELLGRTHGTIERRDPEGIVIAKNLRGAEPEEKPGFFLIKKGAN